MKTIFYSALIGILFLTISCGRDTSTSIKVPEGLLKYRIINEEVYDAPIKTQVSFNVIIDEKDISEARLKELLHYLYDITISRKGFNYNENPTHIFIYAYSTEEKAKSGMGQWVGMISKNFNETLPKIDISETQFRSMNEKQQEKWNLSFLTRQEIWSKLIYIERKAQSEADKKYPMDKPGITIDDMTKNVDLMKKLKKQYEKELAIEYNLERTILDSVSVEGLMNGWAFPE